MQLSSAQLEDALRAAGVGGRLSGLEWLGTRRYAAQLDGRAVVVSFARAADPWAGDALAAEHAALNMLGACADERLPQVIAYLRDAVGAADLLIVSRPRGLAYSAATGRLQERERRMVGEQLAELLVEVHRQRTAQCGALVGGPQAPPRAYLVQRALTAARQLGWPAEPCDELVQALSHVPLDNAAGVLVHAALQPRHVLVELRSGRPRLSGLVGWGAAQAWHPAWDHVGVQVGWPGIDEFAFRVGYGSTYDAAVQRPAEQVRELALLPFHLIELIESGRDRAARRLLSELVAVSAGERNAQTESERV